MKTVSARAESFAFHGLVLLLLVPVFAVAHLPLQDGAGHVENAEIIRRFLTGDAQGLGEFFRVSHAPIPNLLGHMLLAGLLFVLPAFLAEKVVVAGYVVLFPLAVRWTLGKIDPEARFLSFLALPFVFNRLLLMGFYNFSYGVALFFVVVGYWIANRERLTLGRSAVLGLLALAVYLAHLSAVIPALAIIIVLSGAFWVHDRRSDPRTLLALLPALVLTAWATDRFGHAPSAESPEAWSLVGVAKLIFGLTPLVGYRFLDVVLSTCVAALFGLLALLRTAAIVKKRRFARWDTLVHAPLLLGLLAAWSFGAPLFITPRLTIFAFLSALLWFAAGSFPRSVRIAVPCLAGLVVVVQMGLLTSRLVELDGCLGEYLSVQGELVAGKTLLPVSFHPAGLDALGRPLSFKTKPFLHAGSYLAATRRVVDLANYEANQPHFSVSYRPERSPLPDLRELDVVGTTVADIAAYTARTGVTVDYVLLFWPLDEDRRSAQFRPLFLELAAHYELVSTSPYGLALLYRRTH